MTAEDRKCESDKRSKQQYKGTQELFYFNSDKDVKLVKRDPTGFVNKYGNIDYVHLVEESLDNGSDGDNSNSVHRLVKCVDTCINKDGDGNEGVVKPDVSVKDKGSKETLPLRVISCHFMVTLVIPRFSIP